MKKTASTAILAAFLAQMIAPAQYLTASSAEAALSAETVSFYESWKEKYLVKDKYVTDEDQYYVYYSEEQFSGGSSVPVTVSEAHG